MLDELLHFLLELALAPSNDGRHDHDAVFGGKREHALHDLVGGLPGDGFAAFGTVRDANRGIEQAKIVVDFSDGADGRPRAAAGGFLLYGDRRAKTIDGIYVGALHLI